MVVALHGARAALYRPLGRLLNGPEGPLTCSEPADFSSLSYGDLKFERVYPGSLSGRSGGCWGRLSVSCLDCLLREGGMPLLRWALIWSRLRALAWGIAEKSCPGRCRSCGCVSLKLACVADVVCANTLMSRLFIVGH